MTMHIFDVPKHSFHNRAAIEAATECSCYFCCTVFRAADAVEFTDDDTAICPRCGIDAVLPGRFEMEFLITASERWFTGVEDGAATVC